MRDITTTKREKDKKVVETENAGVSENPTRSEVISITKTIGYCELECRMYVDDVKEFCGFMARIKARFSTLMKDFEPIIYYKFHKSLNYYPIR